LNKVYGRTGSLFQPNLKKKEVINNAYFTQLILYIHNNPVKHGFTITPVDWPFSSIHHLKSENEFRLAKNEVIDWFGGPEFFDKAHENLTPAQSVFD
jgi:hypothetical protein